MAKKQVRYINKQDLALNLFAGDAGALAIQWIIRWFMNEVISWSRDNRVKATSKYQPHRTPLEFTIDPKTHQVVIQKKSYYLVRGKQIIQTRVVRLGHANGSDLRYSMFVDLHECETGGVISSMLVNMMEVSRLTKEAAGSEINMDLLTSVAKQIRTFLLRKSPESSVLKAYIRNSTE